jgi:hypothetical protein
MFGRCYNTVRWAWWCRELALAVTCDRVDKVPEQILKGKVGAELTAGPPCQPEKPVSESDRVPARFTITNPARMYALYSFYSR